MIIQIAAFDFIDLTEFYSNLFNIELTEAIDDNFNEIGFGSRYILVNMGTLGLFFLIYVILVVISSLLKFCGHRWNCCKILSKKVNRSLYWKSFITLLNQSFMIVIICALINLKVFSVESKGLTAMSIVAIVFFAVFFIVPIIFIVRLCRNFD